MCILDEDRLGELELQPLRLQARLGQRLRHALDEVRLLELQRRHIDRHQQPVALVTPQRGLLHRLVQHPRAQRHDEAAAFGHWNELGRRHIAQLGVTPADQRLGTHDLAAVQVDLRLVVEPETPSGQRLAHGVVELHAAAQLGARIAAPLMKAESGAAVVLGFVHGRVGHLQQLVGTVAVAGVQRNAHAARHREAQVVEQEGALHHLEHASRAAFGASGVGLMHQQYELVGADAAHGVDLAHRGQQPVGHVGQHAVAQAAAQGVVDVLEAVKVEHQQRERRAVALRQCQRVLDAVEQRAAIGQPGERVGVREQLDAPVGLDALADVAKRIHPADDLSAAELRQRHALEHAAIGQGDGVGGLLLRGGIDGGQAPHIGCRLGHRLQHPTEDRHVVALCQKALGHRPQRRKTAVEVADGAAQIGHQDAVVGGLERGRELGDAIGQLGFGVQFLAAVVHRHHEQRGLGCQLQVGDAPAHGHQLAVGALHPGLRIDVVAHTQRGLLPEDHVFRRGSQIHRLSCAQCTRLDPQQGAGRRIGRDDVQRVRVDQQHRIEQPLDQRARRAQQVVSQPITQRRLGQCCCQHAPRRHRREHGCRLRMAAQDSHAGDLVSPAGSKK